MNDLRAAGIFLGNANGYLAASKNVHVRINRVMWRGNVHRIKPAYVREFDDAAVALISHDYFVTSAYLFEHVPPHGSCLGTFHFKWDGTVRGLEALFSALEDLWGTVNIHDHFVDGFDLLPSAIFEDVKLGHFEFVEEKPIPSTLRA